MTIHVLPSKAANPLLTINSVTRIVEQARNVVYPTDPLLSDDLSRVISTILSIVKRHGILIETSMCDALIASERYEVERRVRLPITTAGRAAASAGGPTELPLEGDIIDDVEVDILAVDAKRRHAFAVQVKRGNGKTDTRKRRQIERDLRAAEVTLRDFVASRGHCVDSASVVITDIYGSSGFDPDLTILGRDLDLLFQVPVLLSIQVATAALRTTLSAMLPEMLTPMSKGAAIAEPPFGQRLSGASRLLTTRP